MLKSKAQPIATQCQLTLTFDCDTFLKHLVVDSFTQFRTIHSRQPLFLIIHFLMKKKFVLRRVGGFNRQTCLILMMNALSILTYQGQYKTLLHVLQTKD